MAKKAGTEATVAPLTMAGDGSMPVSLGQERFWFLSRLYPDTPDYNIPLAVMIDGPGVDRVTLQRNLDAVVAGQEIFRTTFHERDGGVVQVVHASLHLDVEYEDRAADYAAKGGAFVESLAVEHGAIRFQMDHLPLFSVKLVRLAPTCHLVLLNLHHLISDGWSNSLLSQLLSTPASAPAPEPPPRQYRDFVALEQAWLKSAECQTQLSFWKDLLRDLPQPPVFVQRDRHAAVNAGGFVAVELPSTLCDRIAQHCSAVGCTQFQYYIGCFALLMTRYANVDDLVIGTPVANRNQTQFLETCGLFINTLPLRFQIDATRSFAQALGDCAARVEACLACQELPYAELVKHVQVKRALNENPLFNLHFAFQYFPHLKSSSDFRLLAFDHGIGKFDLNCFVEISGAGNRLSLTYRRRAFDDADIKRLADDFLHVLALGLRAPTGALRDVEFLPPASLSRLVGPVVARPRGNWYMLFGDAARKWPMRQACADADGSLTYGELETLVTRAAGALAACGVRSGDRVLLRAARGRYYAIGLLACLRLGAVYLPIPEDAPQALLEQVEREAGARLVLGAPRVGTLSQLTFADALAVTSDCALPSASVNDNDAAYIVYTSGSTGTPKGVVVTHGGLVNYTLSLLERLDNPSLASFAHLSALDADLGNTAIFPALASGAALLLPDSAALLDATRLAAFFARYPADAAKMVPSHLRAMRTSLPGILPRRVLICGGDTLDSELVDAVRAASPALQIVNHYGPAETTIGVLTHEMTVQTHTPIPLGIPIANTRIYLLDRHGRTVPRGVVGELGIAGMGLATGYLEHPELTGRRFIATALENGARLYRSGDLAMLDANGAVIFLGRGDNRVKIGGVMVQPEEVTASLMQHPAVTAAHAWAQNGVDGNARLMAAVVLREPVELNALRAYLLRSYKPAQCPALVALPSLPLNANGKVDVHALRRAWEQQGSPVGASLPRDPVELELLGLFQRTLGQSTVALDAGFFELGGTSLQAISLIARISEVFGLNVPVSALFEGSSVQGLAEIVRRLGDGASKSPLVTLSDAGQDELFVWVHPAGGNAMCYLPMARQLAPARASVAFNAFGRHAGADIPALARDYDRELKSCYATRRVVLVGWSMGALIAHEMAVLAAQAGHVVPLVLLDQPVPDAAAEALSYEVRVKQYLEKVEVFTGRAIGEHYGPGGEIDFERVLQAFQRLDLLPLDTSVAAFRAFIDVLVHDNAIISAFRPRQYSGPTLLLRARERAPLGYSAANSADAPADLGWHAYCSRLELGEADGNHMTMLNSFHATGLAATLDAWVLQRS
ncbi:non-ribosomal peptide synthetase [Paraburkholderia humisilvae]|nr:alpha/beta fold hydrolase [Paraburkholderia humisilvae]